MTEEKIQQVKNIFKGDMKISAHDLENNLIYTSEQISEMNKDSKGNLKPESERIRDLNLPEINVHLKQSEIANIKNDLAKQRNQLISESRRITLSSEVSNLADLKASGEDSNDWTFDEMVDFDRHGRTFAIYKSDLEKELQPNE